MCEVRCSANVSFALSTILRSWWQIALGFCLCFSTAASAADWTIEDLGSLSGNYSAAVAINARGQVTGSSGPANGNWHAFFYDGTNPIKSIGTLPGANGSEASGINVRGQIVGGSGKDTDTGEWHAFLYDSTNGMTDLGTLGGFQSYSWAESINSHGQVVGESLYTLYPDNGMVYPYPMDVDRAFFYDYDGIRKMQELGAIGGSTYPQSYAIKINDNGLIVGWSTTDTIYRLYPPGCDPTNEGEYCIEAGYVLMHAAMYDGIWHDLGTLGGDGSTASSVNNLGQIVGHSSNSENTATHAFLYDNGFMYDIHPPNWGWSVASDINNNGLIVGIMQDFFNPRQSAFLYDGASHDLNNLPEVVDAGWGIVGAYDINDSGQIVGEGLIGGKNHAYRLHPQSTSRYMSTVDVNTLYNLGCSQTNQRGIAILTFGQPLDNSVGGLRDQNTIYGTTLFRGILTETSKIEQAVRSFLDGYYICNGQPGTAEMTVAVGTSNAGYFVTREHGQVWGAMVSRLNDYIIANGYSDRLSVIGAIDIEQGDTKNTANWSPPAQAIAWVDGFASTSSVGYINFGSADGCPPAGKTCNNGWTQANIQYVSWGTPVSRGPVPEIYYNVPAKKPTNALQWATLATLNSSTPREIPGVLSTWQACLEKGCKDPTNTPLQAWQQLMDALYNANPSMAPDVYPSLYSSDITWQN